MSEEIIRRVDDVLDGADVPERHTYFQMKHFIIGKECTVQGQLWQVVRELRARRESLETLTDQLADLDDDIKLAQVNCIQAGGELESLTRTADEVSQLTAEIRLNKIHRQLRSMYRTKAGLERKVAYLSQEVAYLLSAYETLSKAEPLKPLDDVSAQKQYWNEKLTEELNLRLLLHQPIDPDFVRTVMSLDDETPVKKQMTVILQKVQDQMIADRQRALKRDEEMRALQERHTKE